MSEQHTPGKLRLERDPMHFDSMSSIRGGEHREHLGPPDELMIEVGGWSPAQEANARRLAACWNALDGISTSQIEAAARSGSIAYALHKVISQREELLEALKKAEAALSDIGDAEREPGDDVAWCEARAAQSLPFIRAAIAKVEGGGV